MLDNNKVKALLQNQEIKKFSRFVVIGVLNTIVGYGSFFILSFVLPYVVALILAHFIGVLHSYIWNKFWTFQSKKNSVLEVIKFNLVYIIALVINLIMLVVLVDIFKIDPRIGQLFMTPVVTIISYIGHRHWSFK